MSGRILYTVDYLNFLMSIFNKVREMGGKLESKPPKQLDKESPSDAFNPNEHVAYSIPPPRYGNMFNEYLSLDELNYKNYIDEKYKEHFVSYFKSENDAAIKNLASKIATEIYHSLKETKGNW
jgi:hypothetical protein